VADPVAAANTVADFLGGDLNREAMATAADPSLYHTVKSEA